jgi:hypothetical protein
MSNEQRDPRIVVGSRWQRKDSGNVWVVTSVDDDEFSPVNIVAEGKTLAGAASFRDMAREHVYLGGPTPEAPAAPGELREEEWEVDPVQPPRWEAGYAKVGQVYTDEQGRLARVVDCNANNTHLEGQFSARWGNCPQNISKLMRRKTPVTPEAGRAEKPRIHGETTNCIHCFAAATCWTGHVVKGDVHVIAGWCKPCHAADEKLPINVPPGKTLGYSGEWRPEYGWREMRRFEDQQPEAAPKTCGPAFACRLGEACSHHNPKPVAPFAPSVDDYDLLPDAGILAGGVWSLRGTR